MNIEKDLPGTIKNEPMARHCTYRIGGPAEFFYTAKTIEQLEKAISVGRNCGLAIFILGRGSNILVSDAGVKGLVISVETEAIKQEGGRVIVDAGMSLGRFVHWTVRHGLTGMEFAAGIPGSVGGGIRGNAGAYGSELKNHIESVTVMTAENQKKVFSNDDCQFGYRDSIFKHTENIVLRATFSLKEGDPNNSYMLIKKYSEHRASKQDYSIPSAGCTFKNPKDNPAAKMIDELGLKGKRIGDAMVSDTHANFIVNVGQARAADVLKLIAEIKTKVKEKYGVDLEEEIMKVGF